MNYTNVRLRSLVVALTSVLLASYGCDSRTSTSEAKNPKSIADEILRQREEGYMLRNTEKDTVGKILRYERYLNGKGNTLTKGPGKSISSEDEHFEKVITETEVTAVNDGHSSQTKVRYLEDIAWVKRKETGGKTTSEYHDGRFKGETLWGREKLDGDWTYSLIGNDPTDAQRKRLGDMGRKDPPMYPDYKVKVGDTWKVKMRDYPEWAMRNGVKNADGEVDFKFVKLVSITDEKLALNKENCAEIKVTMKMKGTFSIMGGDLDVQFDQTGTLFRSISKLIDVAEVKYQNVDISGTIVFNGVDVKIKQNISGDETVKRTYK